MRKRGKKSMRKRGNHKSIPLRKSIAFYGEIESNGCCAYQISIKKNIEEQRGTKLQYRN